MSRARPLSSALALRVALVVEGRITTEKMLTEGALSFDGKSLLEGPDAESLATFAVQRGQASLTHSLSGRLEIEDSSALRLGDRGRLDHGTCGLLFQVIEAPVARRSPGLPASMRSGAGIDGRFTAIALASLLGHFAFVVVLEHMDPPYVHASAPSARVVELLMDAPAPPPPAPPELPTIPTDEAPTDPTEVADAERPHDTGRDHGGPRTVHSGPSETMDASGLVASVSATLDHALIGAIDTSGLAGTTPNFAEVTRTMEAGAAVGGSSSTLHERTGGGTVDTHDLGVLALASGGGGPRDEGAALEESGPVGVVHPGGGLIDEPSSGVFDAQVVTRALGRRLTAIRRCYERELRDSMDLAGSLDMTFTIEESGTVSRVHATEDTLHSPRLTECVSQVFRSIPRFNPGPEGGSVIFTYPLVFQPGS